MTFGEKLKWLCREHGLTQKQLAAVLHVSRSAVAKWMSGRGIPCKETIQDICEFFGVEEAWLFGTKDLRLAIEAYMGTLEKVQMGFDAAFSVWNTILLFLRIICTVLAMVGGFASPFPWLFPIAATSMWDTVSAVHILYETWTAWWYYFTIRGTAGGRFLHFASSLVAILCGITCGLALYTIASFLVYPPIGNKTGACHIREALYRFGSSFTRNDPYSE